jgi:hypothetical protein
MIIDNDKNCHHMHKKNGTSLNTMAFTKERLGTATYDSINNGEDYLLVNKLCYNATPYSFANKKINYIYRFGEWDHITNKNLHYNSEYKEIILNPHWNEDYVKIAEKVQKQKPSIYSQSDIKNSFHVL